MKPSTLVITKMSPTVEYRPAKTKVERLALHSSGVVQIDKELAAEELISCDM